MPETLPGVLIPTTNIWDTNEIYDIDVNSLEFKELLVRLYQNLNNMALAVNDKDTGYYPLVPYINSQVFFPDPALDSTTVSQPVWRAVSRVVVNFGVLPNTGVKSVPHGIMDIGATFSFTRIYGAASDQIAFSYIPLPYASPTLANNIELSVDATNVTITTGSNRSNYTVCYVIVEYITT
jgi:hypothetical protein